MPRYRLTATIKTSFPFPIDMLRYDRCHPRTEQDASEITRSITDAPAGTITVQVEKFADTVGIKHWEDRRWASFGAAVTRIDSERVR